MSHIHRNIELYYIYYIVYDNIILYIRIGSRYIVYYNIIICFRKKKTRQYETETNELITHAYNNILLSFYMIISDVFTGGGPSAPGSNFFYI